MPGIRTHTAKLTPDDEKDVVEMYRNGAKISEIRAKYGCGQARVTKILDAAGITKEEREERKKGPRNTVDLTGQRFGRLVALRDVGSKNQLRIWEFQCDCGKIIQIAGRRAVSGNTKSCGCQKIDSLKAQKTDHTGKRYGHLEAIEYAKTLKRSIHWRFRCDCGNDQYVADVNAVKERTKKGERPSCGCGQFRKATYKDFTGLRIGMLVAVERVSSAKYGGSFWKWKCDCGTFVERTQSSVKASAENANCGCKISSQAKDRTGERFGNLVAIRLLEERTQQRANSTSTKIYWLMQCDCGKQIEARINDCVTGRKTSCGCNPRGNDTVQQIVDGTFRNAEQDHYFYVFPMQNYPDQCKPGITEDLEDRVKQSRGHYGEVYNYLQLPRVEAWLIEQAVLRSTQLRWKPPSELVQMQWPGYTELRQLSCEQAFDLAESFHDELQEMGRGPFAAEYLVASPKLKKQLLGMT